MGAVCVVGSFNVDHVWHCDALPAPGATLAGRYSTGPGGKGFNQAIAARRAGAQVQFVCALGDDSGAALARQLAADDGLTLHAHISDAPTGTAGIFVGNDAANSIVIGAGANAQLHVDFIQRQSQAICTAAVLLVQLESPLDSITHALGLARAAQVATVLNPAPANAKVSAELLALADVITPNESEFAALLAAHTQARIAPESIAACEDAQLHQHCRVLLPHGSVIITLGAHGCFVSHAQSQQRGDSQGCYRLAAAPAKPVDSTGAGDAFNGALCAAWAAQPDAAFAQHVAFANCYAARAIEAEGAAAAMPYFSAVS